jgi:hypothetical protein
MCLFVRELNLRVNKICAIMRKIVVLVLTYNAMPCVIYDLYLCTLPHHYRRPATGPRDDDIMGKESRSAF